MGAATDWKEVIPEGEEAELEGLAERLRAIQRTLARGGPAARALHAKQHVAAEGEFTVLPDLPEEARVGIFASPGKYRALVRFSNGRGGRYRDSAPDVRGVAIKLLGVPGKKIIPGLEGAATQDFLMINMPATAIRTASDFVWLVEAAQQPALLLPRAIARFGLVGAFRLVTRTLKSLSAKIVSMATTPFHSALPIRFGASAVKYTLIPHAQADPGSPASRSRDHIADEITARLAREPVVYDFGVQFYLDEQRTPIEDPSREWKESDTPVVKLARLTLPVQDVRSPRGQKISSVVDTLSFDPWHAPLEFRPLGSLMRARNAAYRLSTQERKAAPEPGADLSFD